jgi:hypothetical protein
MKKLLLCSFAAMLAFTFIPNEVKASNGPITSELPADPAAAKTILTDRLDEIKSMDKSAMSFNEKQALRKEVRSIDKTLHDGYGGIYISVGALIIIILLLIILF